MRLNGPLLALLLLVALGWSDAAAARSDAARVGQALQHFEAAALWHDGRTLVPPRKWAARPRIRILGAPGEALTRMAFEVLTEATRLAGLVRERPGGDATLVVRFESTAGYVISGRAAACYATTRWNARGEIVHAELVVNVAMRPMLRQCLAHEAMHAFGFPGHPHGFDSVLSYLLGRDRFTPLDELAFAVLYDPRLRADAGHLDALTAARRIIAERLGVAPAEPTAGPAEDGLGRAAAALRDAAESGQVYAQRQLGLALAAGRAMPRDEAEARAWWRRAAERGDPESQQLLDAATDRSAVERNARD